MAPATDERARRVVTPADIADGVQLVYDRPRARWLLFRDPVKTLAAWRPVEVAPLLREVEAAVEERSLHAAGFLSYEAAPAFDPALRVKADDGFPLAFFGCYAAAEPVDLPPFRPEEALPALAWASSIERGDYDRRIARIREYIAAGDTYQVNYTFRLRAPMTGSPWALFLRMIAAQGDHYGAFAQIPGWTLCSASPELFFERDGDRVTTRPMKGTAPRGRWLGEDRARAERLRASEKNRAENVMIVDMARNDLGRVAEVGSVKAGPLFEVERYPTVWQMTSRVECRTRAGLAELLGATFPAASITGAPKARTMEIIEELETAPRRIYTGTMGYLSPGRVAVFNVAIRTALVDRAARRAEYGVGGGIVWDSLDAAEFEECRTKARVLIPPPGFDLLETLLWTPDGGFHLLEAHLARLRASAEYFGRPVEWDRLRQGLDSMGPNAPATPHRVRLTVDSGGEPCLEGAPLADLPHPYRVRPARTPLSSTDPFLFNKTTRRDVYDRALGEVAGCHDALLWNERGEVTETCIANVAFRIDGALVTPPRECGLLAGLQRAVLLERGELREEIVRLDDLSRVEEILLMNSVRGVWPAELEPAEAT